MNFYEKFKIDVDAAVRPLYDTVRNLEKQVANIEKRVAEEKKQSESLEQRIAKLKELSTDALTSSRNRYEKFKNSMRKLSAQLLQSQETVHIFEDELIPKKRQELSIARQKAGAALYAFWVSKRPLCEELLTKLIDNIVTEYDGFLNSVSLSVQDYFQGDVTSYNSPFNGVMTSANMAVWPILRHPRINRNSWRINNKPPAEIAAKPIVNPRTTPEPPTPPEIAPAEAQGVAEGSRIPSEAGSQAPEAQPAPGEALETTSEPVGEDSEQSKTLLTGKV
jgi:hypothetical protein